jgi:GT2 family glycosyltransferase
MTGSNNKFIRFKNFYNHGNLPRIRADGTRIVRKNLNPPSRRTIITNLGICWVVLSSTTFLVFMNVAVLFDQPAVDNHNIFNTPFPNFQSPSSNTNANPYVSLVVFLTHKKADVLAALLPSILQQNQGYFEIVIADSGCLDETKHVIKKFLDDNDNNPRKIRYKYIEACDNPGYAIGTNRAVALAAESSQWILLLNENIVMQNDTFVENMVQLVEAKETAAAIGCKMVTTKGDKLIEAGGVLWNDASTAEFGRDRTDLDAPELSFPRPVDYVSGACLLVNKSIFNNYGGFDGKQLSKHYQDLDLQTHIQHHLKMEVWMQPSAVATHADPASIGKGDSSSSSKSLMKSNVEPFKEKWKEFLVHHPPTPYDLNDHSKHVELLKAADLRARDPTKARILYLDELIPNKSMGRGFGRAFDNIFMLADLGHRITVAALSVPTEEWCNDDCLQETRRLGVEVVTTPWEEFTESRVGFYDIVLVSRPSTFRMSYKKWREFYKKSPFTIVYDCEALWYRRDVDMLNLYKNKGIKFPSIGDVHENYIPVKELMTSEQKTTEETILKLADIIVPVSEKEADIIADLIPGINIQAIGHVMNLPDRKTVPFQERKGILFLASFNNDMYYNGDAIWYFLKETYPLVLKDSFEPIPLSIAGRDIPDELRNFTRDNGLDDHVTFFESLDDTTTLFDNSRVFIAPHLYGSGIQFKVSVFLLKVRLNWYSFLIF